jgi:hypothetical protein
MNNKTKLLIYRYLIPVLIFGLVWLVLEYFYPEMIIGKKGFFAALVTYLFMPKIKKINFLRGQNIQIKWFILGKVILLPMNDK